MARKYKETTEMVDTPDYNPNGGFPDAAAVKGENKRQPGKGLEEIGGSGMQHGAHPAKTQSKIMRYF